MDNRDKSPGFNYYGEDDEPSNSGIDFIKRNARQDFFTKHLAESTLFSAQAESFTEDDEDDSETNSKSKKKRSVRSSGFLSSIMPRVPAISKTESETRASEADSLSIAESHIPNLSKEQENDTGKQGESIELSPRPIEPYKVDANIEETDQTQDASNRATQEVSRDRSPKRELEETVVSLHDASSTTQNEVAQAGVNDESNVAYAHSRVVQNESDYLGQTTTSPEEKPQIEERTRASGAVVAFLGAEVLSRRRDRKVRREVRSNKKEADTQIKNIKKEQLSQLEAQNRLREHQLQQIARQKSMEEDFIVNQKKEAEMLEQQHRLMEAKLRENTDLKPVDSLENSQPTASVSTSKIEKVALQEKVEKSDVKFGSNNSEPKEKIENIQSKTEAIYEKPKKPKRSNDLERQGASIYRDMESMPQLVASRHENLIKAQKRRIRSNVQPLGQASNLQRTSSLGYADREGDFGLNTPAKPSSQSMHSRNSTSMYMAPIKTGVYAALVILILALLSYLLV